LNNGHFMFDRRLILSFDWILLGITFMLGTAGIVTVYSAVTAGFQDTPDILYFKQLTWYGAGFIVMITAFSVDYRQFERFAYMIYFLCISLLTAVLFFGKYVSGSRRWLAFGPVSIQPSEMVKVAIVIILARYYARHIHSEGLSWKELIKPFILTFIPFILIVRQPDLGTAMMIFLIAVSITLFIRIEKCTFFLLAGSGISLVPMVWLLLKGYQKQRILTFLNPDRDPLGAGYHIIQSKIAIGSGAAFGKGLFKGTQNALAFLPEQHTDFIFSVFAEEWGFAGCMALIIIFLFLIIRGLNIAYRCRDSFGTILSVGVCIIISWQVFINIGMVMGLMPVVGVPLPFISYGGSSVITTMICIGILMNVSMRQFVQD